MMVPEKVLYGGFWLGMETGRLLGLKDDYWLGLGEGFWLGSTYNCLLGWAGHSGQISLPRL